MSNSVPRVESATDGVQLSAGGHVDELPRRFSALSLLALAFSVSNSYMGYSAVFIVPYYAGAGPGVVYSPIIAAVFCFTITCGLAELASAFPSSAGQYHYAYMVTPSRHQAVVAFYTGWLSLLAWLFASASAAIVCAQICADLIGFYNPEYVSKQYQIYLIYVLIIWICTFVIVFLPRSIPVAETTIFGTSLIGFVVMTITLLATSSPKLSAEEVFVTWNNETGWNDGIAAVIAFGQAMYSFLAIDSASHIAEEVPNPSRDVPRAMWLTMVIGLLTVVPWTITFMFSIKDIGEVSAAMFPMKEVIYQATANKGVTTFFTVVFLFVYMGSSLSCILTTGRLTWAFARDNGLPHSNVFRQMHPTLQTPANATFCCAVLMTVYGLIYIASTTAFNSIVSLAILSLNVTYAIPQGILLFRGRKNVLPSRPFDLGVFGTFCNAFSVLCVSFYTVIFCFPTFLPVELNSMNYVSVVFTAAVTFISALWWIAGKRRTFSGPQLWVESIEVSDAAQKEQLEVGVGNAVTGTKIELSGKNA